MRNAGIIADAAAMPAEQPHAHAHGAYRPDIDGLRALAVLPVVLNHVGVRGFSGGFIGVDIFFVISGFLITGILVRDLAAGRHSIAEFYRRRVLRIFPALFAMLIATSAIAGIVLLPTELVRYARSLGATALFGSNILFYSESGYFDVASTGKPLLHTWSLAVEEQFYILWPLLLAALPKGRRRTIAAVVALVTLASFLASAWGVRHDMSATFFLLPTRAWELGIGGLIALGPNPIRHRWVNEALALAGLVAILWCIPAYDEFTPFPGVAAAVPCVGTALLLMTGRDGTLVARLLSIGPALFVGRISYSLYLWHWPVVVFARIALFWSFLDPVAKGIELAASIALGAASWRFVERPFRGGAGWPTKRVLTVAVAAIGATVSIAAATIAARGLPARFSARQQAIGAYLDYDGERAYRRGTCFATDDRANVAPACLAASGTRPSLLLLGDSHGAHLWPGLARKATGYEVLQSNAIGCRPVLIVPARSPCEARVNRLLTEWAPRHHPAAVLLAGNWRLSDMAALEATLADPRVRSINPVLIGRIPQYTAALPRLLVAAEARGDPKLPQRNHLGEVFAVDAAMRAIARRRGVAYISLVDLLCKARECLTVTAPNAPIQFDYSHLTVEGSTLVAERMLPQLRNAAARVPDAAVATANPR